MSDHWLHLVPVDPAVQPDREAADWARELLAAMLPGADSAEANFFDQTTFIGCGSNWSRMACPGCGAQLDS